MTVTLADWVQNLVDDQADLTAVERFSQHHDASGDRYEALLPATPPGPGEQYAFTVDLDACTGCKACVAACHRVNGLDEGESFRTVGLLHGLVGGTPTRQTVTAACHHCADPACMTGCPANAYIKEEGTGIVVHLDDQCIGCRYCTLTCPYDVPVYNDRLGIVRKCDMCRDRLGAGEAPACVQGCPNSAISIEVRTLGPTTRSLVPGAPSSSITAPTTRYVTRSPDGAVLTAADAPDVEPAHGHPPLAVMLVLTQVAVGTLAASVVGGGSALIAPAAGVLAMAASVLHLGRPLVAWRAVLGLRHSWLSREIVAFSGFAALALGDVVLDSAPLRLAALAVGTFAIGCSVMVYHRCHRPLWAWWRSSIRFGLTAASAGAALTVASGGPVGLGVVALATGAIKVVFDANAARPARAQWLDAGAVLLRGPLRAWALWRVTLGLVGCASLMLGQGRVPAAVAAVMFVLGDLCERHLWFRAAAAPRMPGGLP